MQKYQKKKDTSRKRAPFGESGDWRDFPRKRLRNAWEFPHGHCKSMSGEKRSPGSTWLSAEIYGCDLYAFLCSRRAGGMTGYRYAPVRVRSFRPDCSCVYGILVRKLEGERTVALTVIPGLSPDKEAVHRFAEWCGREQLDPARLPEAIRAAFPDTVKTP